MKFDAILFDLDGTLLPMDNDVFTKGYLSLLARTVAPLGYEPKNMIGAMWQGVGAMLQNDRSRPNCDVFWETFAALVPKGKAVYEDIPHFDAFYGNEFHQAKAFTSPTPLAAEAVRLAKEKAGKVVLATNPFFPRIAVEARLSWAALDAADFALITTYENSGCCKPDPTYYLEICEKLGLEPTRCLMIGNNAEEDIGAAEAAGLSAFLLTDCLIDEKGLLKSGNISCPKGDYNALLTWLREL